MAENLMSYINLNPKWFISKNMKGQIAHEYGHAIENALIHRYGNDKIQGFLRQILKDNGLNTLRDIKQQISPYAAFKTIPDLRFPNTFELHELIPEIISGHYTSTKRKDIVDIIYNDIMRLYRG